MAMLRLPITGEFKIDPSVDMERLESDLSGSGYYDDDQYYRNDSKHSRSFLYINISCFTIYFKMVEQCM